MSLKIEYARQRRLLLFSDPLPVIILMTHLFFLSMRRSHENGYDWTGIDDCVGNLILKWIWLESAEYYSKEILVFTRWFVSNISYCSNYYRTTWTDSNEWFQSKWIEQISSNFDENLDETSIIHSKKRSEKNDFYSNQSLNPSIGFDWHSTETLFRFSSSTNSVWYSSSGLDPHYHHYALCDHHDRSTYPWKFFIDLSRMKCHEIDFLLKFRNWEKASWVESKFSMYSFEIEFHWEDVEVVDEHVRVVRRWMTRKRLVDDEYYVE